jgi:malate synthase
MHTLEFRAQLERDYTDVLTPDARAALEALAPFDRDRKALMAARIARRRARAEQRQPIAFLDPSAIIPRTRLTVEAVRQGDFEGSDLPPDLERQWIQGTGPGARPRATLEQSLRNVAYALLSGADGWMFDGEDALGQVSTMSLDNQRNLRLALAREPEFLAVAETVAGEMNRWAEGFLGRPIIGDWRAQLDFTTPIFRARGLHLDDRHVRLASGDGFSASIVDLAFYIMANHRTLRDAGRTVVLYLPKIQTAEEAALWNDMLAALESHLGLPEGAVKTYVLVEQLEACFQLMEIRAALGSHFVGYNTGRWDYINSVSDAMAWDPGFQNPNIDAITMTYGYMRHYEDRVRRAVNTPDRNGRCALWQGGMEPNIPVGSRGGRQPGHGTRRGRAPQREQAAGASGKWVAHWKMVHIVRPVWERRRSSRTSSAASSRPSPTPTRTPPGSGSSSRRPRTVAGARDLLSVALQYGNAFGQGLQAAALKPADFFGNDDVLYLMEDMATGEIRVSILWEWLHKGAPFTERRRGHRREPPATPSRRRSSRGSSTRSTHKLVAAGQPGRARALQVHDAAHLARDRGCGRHPPHQGTVVHRPAEPDAGQPRPRRSHAPHRGLHGPLRGRRHPADAQPRLLITDKHEGRRTHEESLWDPVAHLDP